MTISNIAAIVRTHAKGQPDATAIAYGDRKITWAELEDRSNKVAQGLRFEGIHAQDRVARIDKNAPEYYELLFGATKLNAVVVDVNWRLAPPEMAQIINDAEAKVLVVGEEFLPHLQKIENGLLTVNKVIVVSSGDVTHDRHEAYETWLARQANEDPGIEADDDDVALQLYTSGTTGLPKGVMLTNRNLFAFIDKVPEALGLSPESVAMVVMPLFHIAGSGWSLAALAPGASIALHREVDPAAILRSIENDRVTHSFFVPAVLQFLIMTPTASTTDVSSLELIAYGASPITDKVLQGSMDTFKCKFVQVYGLTETTGAITQLDAEDHDPANRPDLLRSCGKPYEWVQVRVVDGDGNDVADGEVGELWVKSVQVMKGYWKKPLETSAAITDNGWFKTGDAGYWKDGYLYLHDRVKDMIVSGGENVYPAEVENALMGHPAVADVAVIGVPHEKWGETVKAVVVKAAGADVTPDDLIEFARERVARYKCPTSIDFVDALPRNPSGKILKRELRDPYWAGRERRIN